MTVLYIKGILQNLPVFPQRKKSGLLPAKSMCFVTNDLMKIHIQGLPRDPGCPGTNNAHDGGDVCEDHDGRVVRNLYAVCDIFDACDYQCVHDVLLVFFLYDEYEFHDVCKADNISDIPLVFLFP
jgi:hypothetical protein